MAVTVGRYNQLSHGARVNLWKYTGYTYIRRERPIARGFAGGRLVLRELIHGLGSHLNPARVQSLHGRMTLAIARTYGSLSIQRSDSGLV